MTRTPSAAMILAILACGTDGSVGSDNVSMLEPTRTDSAGVTLLVHDGAVYDHAPRITLDVEPLAEIVGSEEDEEADISTITPSTFLADGRLVGVDRQRQVIAIFAADGSGRQEFGRRGSGPGEYGFLSRVVPMADGRLMVHDARNGRVSLIDPDDGQGPTHPTGAAMGAGAGTPIGVVGDKLLSYSNNFATGGNRTPPGVKAVLLDLTTDSARRVFTTGAPEREEDAPRTVSGPDGAVMTVMAISILPLQEIPSVFAWDGEFVVADPNRNVLEWHDTTGVLRQVLRSGRPRVAVSDQVWRAFVDQSVDRMVSRTASQGGAVMMTSSGPGQPDPDAMRAQLLSQEHADSLPGFKSVQLTPGGTLWVLDYQVPGTDGWAATAFDREGRVIGRFTADSGAPPVVFGDDRVVFRTEDDLGIATFTVKKLVFHR